MKYIITFVIGHYCPFKSCPFPVYAMSPAFLKLLEAPLKLTSLNFK